MGAQKMPPSARSLDTDGGCAAGNGGGEAETDEEG